MSNISITNPGGGSTPVDSIEFIQGNDGINVPSNPTTHILFLLGDNTQGVDLSGNAGTYTETISIFNATTSQKGVVLLASNAETIAGTDTTKATTPDDIKAKLGAQTLHGLAYGNATTGAVQWLAEATDGQIPIGDTGGVPILGNITSTNGSVTVTNAAGSIDLSVTNSFSGTVTTSDGLGQTGVLNVNVPVASNSAMSVRVNIVGYDSANGVAVGGEILATFKNNAGTLTGSGLPDQTFNKDAALNDATFTAIATGTNIQIEVTGVAAHTINWKGNIDIVSVT